MKILWEVDDGSIGPARRFVTTIDDEDLAACTSDREREDLITDMVQEDFYNRIGWVEVKREP